MRGAKTWKDFYAETTTEIWFQRERIRKDLEDGIKFASILSSRLIRNFIDEIKKISRESGKMSKYYTERGESVLYEELTYEDDFRDSLIYKHRFNLNNDEYDVLYFRNYVGFSVSETATALGLTSGNVATIASRANSRLRKLGRGPCDF